MILFSGLNVIGELMLGKMSKKRIKNSETEGERIVITVTIES